MNDQRWQKKMSLDFQQQPPLYQQDVDFIQDPQPPHHHFEEPMDAQDHPAYIFSDSRYRTNASSSSSLGHSFDALYRPPFGDSVPPFNGSYDMINNLSSGKVSPLTPSDSVTSLHHPPGFPPKDYPHQEFSDMESRRLNPPYHSEYQDNYAIGGINNGIPFSPSAMNHFTDRLASFPPDRYRHPNGPPSGMRAFVLASRFVLMSCEVSPRKLLTPSATTPSTATCTIPATTTQRCAACKQSTIPSPACASIPSPAPPATSKHSSGLYLSLSPYLSPSS